ncbi:MAG: type II secretion system F family protein [Candidatus Aenigmatarchaeota archaeon]
MKSSYPAWISKHLENSGLRIRPEKFVKTAISIPIILLPVAAVAQIFFGIKAAAAVLGLLALAELLLHLLVIYLSKKRASIVEEILPDALRLISSNLRAGIIPEKAFLESARPEFGPLSEQIREAGKALMLGNPIKIAFLRISEKIDSSLLKKTISLVIEGVTRGGNIASLLDGLADDLKSTSMLKKDIKAQVTAYSMFIFLAIGFGAPLLFASSLFLVETLIGLGTLMPSGTISTGGISLAFQSIDISKDFLLYFQISIMCISSIFGGILMGLISEGKEFSGLKYIPVLILLNMGIFYIVKFKLLASFAIF